jgi:hypothetical protein
MSVNIPLLTEVMVKIRREPWSHDQTNWGIKTACGTKMCIAGHTAILAGARPVWSRNSALDGHAALYSMSFVRPRGQEQMVDVSDYAEDQLGLDAIQASSLFLSMSDTEVWDTLNIITGGEITLEKIDAIIAEQDAPKAVAAEPIRQVVKTKPKELVR